MSKLSNYSELFLPVLLVMKDGQGGISIRQVCSRE